MEIAAPIQIQIEQRHIDAGIQLSTSCPAALAIKEELDKRPTPAGYLRVERVVSVTSSVYVTEHRIIKRKGREEIDLSFEKYWINPIIDKDNNYSFNIWAPYFAFMVAFGMKLPVQPLTFEIYLDEPHTK